MAAVPPKDLAHGTAQKVPPAQLADNVAQSLRSVPLVEPPQRVQPVSQPRGVCAVGPGLTFSTLMLAFALVSMNLIP